MADTLVVATAGLRPEQINDSCHCKYPRVDYIELQKHVDIEILDYRTYDNTSLGQLLRKLETRVRSDLYLTFLSLLHSRHHHSVFAMSERAGIPYAGLKRFLPKSTPFISMFQCWSERQEKMMMSLDLFSAMDAIVVHCQSMKQHFSGLGVPQEKLHVINYSVDHKFFSPCTETEPISNQIMSIGEIRSRDYPTLFKAVEDLPVQLKVAASGAWYAREKNTALDTPPPDNVTVTGRIPQADLKALYAQSQFVVLPVHDVVYSAGATGVLESGCMGRAVVATRSRGLADFVVDGETGILVEPGDVAAWRDAIEYLLTRPEEARRMGRNARQQIDEKLNLDRYVQDIAQVLQKYSANGSV